LYFENALPKNINIVDILSIVIEEFRGGTIKKEEVILVLVTAILSVPIMAQDYGLAGSGNVDVLGTGIFETKGSALKFPALQDTNADSLTVGNDRALALSNIFEKRKLTTATNDLEIKKNQDSGECGCCTRIIDNVSPSHMSRMDCMDCCIKVNVEDIKIGNRNALAVGPASANNHVKIVTNQQ
jgi:hypothetical protein